MYLLFKILLCSNKWCFTSRYSLFALNLTMWQNYMFIVLPDLRGHVSTSAYNYITSNGTLIPTLDSHELFD